MEVIVVVIKPTVNVKVKRFALVKKSAHVRIKILVTRSIVHARE